MSAPPRRSGDGRGAALVEIDTAGDERLHGDAGGEHAQVDGDAALAEVAESMATWSGSEVEPSAATATLMVSFSGGSSALAGALTAGGGAGAALLAPLAGAAGAPSGRPAGAAAAAPVPLSRAGGAVHAPSHKPTTMSASSGARTHPRPAARASDRPCTPLPRVAEVWQPAPLARVNDAGFRPPRATVMRRRRAMIDDRRWSSGSWRRCRRSYRSQPFPLKELVQSLRERGTDQHQSGPVHSPPVLFRRRRWHYVRRDSHARCQDRVRGLANSSAAAPRTIQ